VGVFSQIIAKVKGHFTFPRQIGKVRKKRCAPNDTWNFFWKEKNAKFEKFMAKDPNLCWLFGKMFHLWDENHDLHAC
jgi:hypothetical protein